MPRKPQKTRRIAGRTRGNNKIPAELTIARETRAWELKARGYDTKAITAILVAEFKRPITPRAVNLALGRVAATVTADAITNVVEFKGRQVAALQALYEESMAAYRRTVGTITQTSTKETAETPTDPPPAPPAPPPVEGTPPAPPLLPPPPPAPVVVSRVTSTSQRIQAGDPRLLATAMEALRDLRKLLGLDAPLKIALDTPERELTPEALNAKIAALMAEADARTVRRSRPSAGDPPPAP